MKLWHGHADTPRTPARPIPGERVTLRIGTWPIAPGQSVLVSATEGSWPAVWRENRGENSYWEVAVGPFAAGTPDLLITGRSAIGQADPVGISLRIGPRLDVALLWHMHQPLYRGRPGFQEAPWVRLHALRDYYGMGALVLEHPRLRLTFNLTPVLLDQIEDYAERGATDALLELTRTRAEDLSPDQRESLCAQAFDASWHGQVFPHARFRDLYAKRAAAEPFSVADLRDLQVWATLAWFDVDFQRGPIRLVTGRTVAVHELVQKGHAYSQADVAALLDAQSAILRAIIPLYRELQESGQVELTTSPAFHPILPLLVDTDDAVIDRPGSSLPRRFAHPEDADEQVRRSAESHLRRFGVAPSGMWPSEGAVSEAILPIVARHGFGWLGTDQAVLAASGEFGYDTSDPDVLCEARAAGPVAAIFRDTALSDAIGFGYQTWTDADAAAADLMAGIRDRAGRLRGDGARILLVALDGENAWGGYEEDGRPFLRALYRRLVEAADLVTTTPAAWLARAGHVHRLGRLATGSWIDENGSAKATDLGTWIGEEEENRAWELLGDLHDALDRSQPSPVAQDALYAAEGSDWMWWFGQDQDSRADSFFDSLFRSHLRRGWLALGTPPPELDLPIGDAPTPWTFTAPAHALLAGSRLAVRSNCPGNITWKVDNGTSVVSRLAPVGGTMAGPFRHERVLGPFGRSARTLTFLFRCEDCRCTHDQPCCAGVEQVVRLLTATAGS